MHVVPGPCHTPLCMAHWAWVVTWQNEPVPVPTQQAPVGGGGPQAVVEHIVPSPKYVPPWLVQLVWVVTVQKLLPAASCRQQAPVVGGGPQVVAVHIVPSP